ncbi:AraC family transcriptional regulator [Sporomusa malonica]|uniref:Transcriptional regulator, AraC family n=1 Tax=Sporomusa malonica TaxID=112901 RepID=A0A1W2F6V1_9FIRM|nr:AraC family transcriptional regulator [Sporomusa malonica]SMD17246.1 transcriptional regulator, AraC family [Sporomusa malonica]
MAMFKKNKASCIRIADMNNLEVYKASYTTHAFSRHWHDGFGIGVIENGCEVFDYDGRRQYAPQRSIVLMNPGVVHTGSAANQQLGWQYNIMYPQSGCLQEIAGQINEKNNHVPYFPNPVVFDKDCAEKLLNLFSLFEYSPLSMEYQSVFISAMAMILRRHSSLVYAGMERKKDNKVVKLVKEYIYQYYAKNISLGELSIISGKSQFHLLREFGREVGIPPHTYQIFIRIQKAKELLLKGQSILVVALETGFTDQSHFSRYFKRIVGVTPREYVNSSG